MVPILNTSKVFSGVQWVFNDSPVTVNTGIHVPYLSGYFAHPLHND